MGQITISFVLASIIILSSTMTFLSQQPAAAETSCDLSPSVDQSSYNYGDTITLTFNIPAGLVVPKLVISAEDPPNGDPFIQEYYSVASGNSYTVKIPTGPGTSWTNSGSYYIELQLQYQSGDVDYCSADTPYFTFNMNQTPQQTPQQLSTGSQCFKWNEYSSGTRWDTYITNECSYTLTNVNLWSAWQAALSYGPNQVWSQQTYGPFTLTPGGQEHVWQYISLPPVGQWTRPETQLSADNAPSQSSYGHWMQIH